MRALPRIAAVALVATLLAACADDPDPAPTTAPSPSASPAPEPEPVVAPLTGLEVDAELDGPALAAKIDNHPDARPQVGLERADMVVEELVEGGMTRYVAVWHSDVPDEIGPVRSVRPMDPAIVAPFGGPVAYSGGQQRFVDAMQATGLPNVIHGGEYDAYFSRTPERVAPHDVLLEASRIVEDVDAEAPRPQASYAGEDETATAADGEPATALDIAFSPSEARSWRCDDGTWLRAQDGVDDLAGDGSRLDATNVVVLRVEVGDDAGVPSTLLEGRSGEGLVASGCSWAPISWSKGEVGDVVELADAAGDPVLLDPGRTWFELVPVTGSAAAS